MMSGFDTALRSVQCTAAKQHRHLLNHRSFQSTKGPNYMSRKYPVNKPIRFSLIGLFILFFLYSLTQILPVFVELIEANSLYSAIGALGVGICLFTYSVTNSYYVWKLDKVSFLEWDRDQQLIASEKEVSADAFDIRWPMRLLNLFLALLSLVVIAAALFWISKMIATP